MSENGTEKIERVLGIYSRLMNGAIVNKAQAANDYNVNERSIQRNIDDIRNFLGQDAESDGIINSVIYDRGEKGHKLEQIYKLKFSNPEIPAICKIRLECHIILYIREINRHCLLSSFALKQLNKSIVFCAYLFLKFAKNRIN